jgi:hypothetical protein
MQAADPRDDPVVTSPMALQALCYLESAAALLTVAHRLAEPYLSVAHERLLLRLARPGCLLAAIRAHIETYAP